MSYQTKLRNKNRGYMNRIVWQRAMDLFHCTRQITHTEVPIEEYVVTPLLHHSITPSLQPHA